MGAEGRAVRRALRVALLVCGATAGAQGVDPRGDWKTLATPHFRVHFRAELEDQGRRAAASAEAAWRLLASELAPPAAPVDLVLADNADVSNGYASRFPSNRVVVYAQPPVDASALRSFYGDWLQVVITHELAHVFHLDRARGVWRLLRGAFGRNPALFPNAYGPSWLTEGLAVYYESRLTGAGRLLGTQHRLIARAAAEASRVPRLDQLSLAGSVYPLGERAYAYGSLVFEQAARAGGGDGVRRFVDRQSGQLVPWRLDRAARRSFGVSFTDAWRRWRDSLASGVDTLARRAGMTPWREVTSHGWYVDAPRWLGADALVYAANDGRSVPAAERVTLAGDRRRLGRRNTVGPNAPLPGGGLLFAQLDYIDPFTLRSDLYVQDDTSRAPAFGAATAGQRRLTVGARLVAPDARADGAIVAVQFAAGAAWLARVTADGRTVVPLTAASPDTLWAEPRWSPDGRRVAAIQIVRGGRSAVVVLDETGRRLFDVVRDRAVNTTPSWSPDGRRVYWSSDRTGAPQLYVATLGDGGIVGEVLRLTGATTGLTDPAPSPDGAALGALLVRADGEHVAVADVGALTGAPASQDAAFHADSTRLTAVAERAGGALTGYRPWRTLIPRYWTPVLGLSDGGSTTLGALTSGYDVLGRHAYSLDATVNAANGDVEGGAAYRFARLGVPVVDLGASQAWQYDTINVRFTNGTTGRLPLFRRTRAASLSFVVSRPRVRTGAMLAAGASYESRAYTSTSAALVGDRERVLGTSFPAVFVSASWANARRPIRSISPEDGVGLTATVQQRWQNGRLGPQSRRAVGALRAYKSLDLPGFAHHVLAFRAAGGIADAKTATEFSAGGVSGTSAELVPGLRIGDPTRTFGVRGFGASAQRGTRAAAATFEYRAPLALPARGARLLPVFADRLSLATFVDAGSAWCPASVDRAAQPVCLADSTRTPTAPRWLAAAGAELALDAAIAYDSPIRFRLGGAVPFATRVLAPRSVAGYFTLGLGF